jgi:hypothetical protein
VLSDEEKAKGFIRPVRDSYIHVGVKPKYPLRDLTAEEQERHAVWNYVKYEKYLDDDLPVVGRFWTQPQLNLGCQTATKMTTSIAETYARDPKFYGSTYCVHCQKHLPVNEFIWEGTNEVLGS